MLSALAITVLVVTISNPFSLAWLSVGVLAGVALAVVLLAAFIRCELRIDRPLFQLRLFAERGFRTSVALRMFGFLASAPSVLLLPVFLLSFRQLNTATAGVIIAAVSAGMGTGGQVSGRAYDRMGPRAPTLLGFSLQMVVSLALAFSNADTSLVLLGFLTLAAGLSLGLWNVPNNSAMLAAIPPAYLGVGGAFTNVTRTLGGVIGQALATAVVASVMMARGFDVPLGDHVNSRARSSLATRVRMGGATHEGQ